MGKNKTYSSHTPEGAVNENGKASVASEVATYHPEYSKRIKSWQMIEDCIGGEEIIKQSGEKYLPRPSGMQKNLYGNAAYTSYITRAHFPDFTAKFLSGLTGITKINPPKVKIPKSLEYLIEDCDGSGTPLDVFFFQSVRLALKTGRQLIFVDVCEETKRLKLVRYTATELINWGVVNRVYNEKEADFFVLEESVNKSNSIFSHDYESQYRVLTKANILSEITDVESEIFTSIVLDEDGSIVEEAVFPELAGKAFVGLPVVVIGSTDIDIEPDQIPLLGVAKCAIQMYMKDADLSNAMFLTCNPTLCISGVSTDQSGLSGGEVLVGSNVSITLEDSNARAYYTKTDASGLQEVRLSIKTYLEEAKSAGAALLSNEQNGVESGEALRIKAAATTASLSSTSQACARGFEKSIKYMATWMGEDESKVSVEVDMDYLDNMLTPEYINQLTKLFESSIISHKTALVKLKEGKFLDPDLDVDKEIEEIKEEKEAAFEEFMMKESMKDPADDGVSDTSRNMDKGSDKADKTADNKEDGKVEPTNKK